MISRAHITQNLIDYLTEEIYSWLYPNHPSDTGSRKDFQSDALAYSLHQILINGKMRGLDMLSLSEEEKASLLSDLYSYWNEGHETSSRKSNFQHGFAVTDHQSCDQLLEIGLKAFREKRFQVDIRKETEAQRLSNLFSEEMPKRLLKSSPRFTPELAVHVGSFLTGLLITNIKEGLDLNTSPLPNDCLTQLAEKYYTAIPLGAKFHSQEEFSKLSMEEKALCCSEVSVGVHLFREQGLTNRFKLNASGLHCSSDKKERRLPPPYRKRADKSPVVLVKKDKPV